MLYDGHRLRRIETIWQNASCVCLYEEDGYTTAWSGLEIIEAAELTEDRLEWIKCVHHVTDPLLEDSN